MLGFVDTSLELTRLSRFETDANRRLIRAQSRRAGVPARLCYEWDPATGAFAVTLDPKQRQFEDNYGTILALLHGRHESDEAITAKEIAEYWPEDAGRPAQSTLYAWLASATDRKLIRREGCGTKHEPWRYRMGNPDEARGGHPEAVAAAGGVRQRFLAEGSGLLEPRA